MSGSLIARPFQLRRAGTVIMSTGSAAWFAAAGGLDWQIPLSGGGGAGPGGLDGFRAV